MPYSIHFGKTFKRGIKKLQKRYPSIKKDVAAGIEALLATPHLGVPIPGAFGVRKLRLRNSDVGRGKSGGYRMIYYIEDHQNERIFLLLVYAKSDRENVTIQEIKRLMEADFD